VRLGGVVFADQGNNPEGLPGGIVPTIDVADGNTDALDEPLVCVVLSHPDVTLRYFRRSEFIRPRGCLQVVELVGLAV